MRHILFSLVWAVGLAAASASAASAAEFNIVHGGPNSPSVLEITGPIGLGDADRFYELAKRSDKAIVVLRSDGGIVEESLSIAAEINQRGFTAIVGPNAECYSMCAVIWAAAQHRVMDSTAVIGPHAAYRRRTLPDGSFEVSESGRANADVGAFLASVGLSRDAILFFTSAAPDDFWVVTPAIAQKLGIDTAVIWDDRLEEVKERPAPRALARQSATYIFLSGDCAHLLGMDGDYLQAQGHERLRLGHELFGGEIFADLVPQMTGAIKETREEVALAEWCMGAAMDLINEDLPLGIGGPGFDCGKASSPAEQTICADPALWLEDRALSSIYAVLRQKSTERERPGLVDKQRTWIAARNRCGADAHCIHERYQSWFLELSLPVAVTR